jgi:hypothetical protein
MKRMSLAILYKMMTKMELDTAVGGKYGDNSKHS